MMKMMMKMKIQNVLSSIRLMMMKMMMIYKCFVFYKVDDEDDDTECFVLYKVDDDDDTKCFVL